MNDKSIFMKEKRQTFEVIAPWSDNESMKEIGASNVNGAHTSEGNTPARPLQIVRRVNEGIHNISSIAPGEFDFVVVLDLQQIMLRDLRPIIGMAKTLRVLNASQNEIATLPQVDFWSQFRCLSMCFLSQNALRTWLDVQGLEGCAHSLLWLTLFNNPFMGHENARSFVMKRLPFLKAFDNFVTTDQEVVHHAGDSKPLINYPGGRFNALEPRLCIAHLQMSVEFTSDESALQYIRNTEVTIATINADNSPSLRIQKLVRGYLSRNSIFPHFRNMRKLIINAQKRIRGFLLRQLIKRQICELVTAIGDSKLLFALFAPLAHRSFEKLGPMIRRWRTHIQDRKKTAAFEKIRLWCQKVCPRHVQRTRHFPRHDQEFIYYTPEFETDLLALAMRVARRDPYLKSLSTEDRLRHLKERCVQSGISIIRGPNNFSGFERLNSNSSDRSSKSEGLFHVLCKEDEKHREVCERSNVKSTLGVPLQDFEQRMPLPALIRGFCSDKAVEDKLLVVKKHFLQKDLERFASIQNQQLQLDASNNVDTETQSFPNSQLLLEHQSCAVLLHLNQVAQEIQQRLVICNRNILTACVKQQQRLRKLRHNAPNFFFTKTKIRVRGHAPTFLERKKIVFLSRERLNSYRKMKVFIPWTIDMYQHMVMRLGHAIRMCSVGPAKAFAFSYEETKRADAALLIQSVWRAFACRSPQTIFNVMSIRACICIQRWWRFRLGLSRRLDVLRACLLVGASINSRTLFMESNVYHALVDSWPAVRAVVRQHHCHEHHLGYHIVSKIYAKLTLTPEQLLIYNASREERSISHYQRHDYQVLSEFSADVGSTKSEQWLSQRCSAFLPAWMLGAPEPVQYTTNSRIEDTAAFLLVDGVHVEPTDIKRELMHGILEPYNIEGSVQMNPMCKFSTCQHIVNSATRVMKYARQLCHDKVTSSWLMEPSHSVIETTSFVRLIFPSADEARKRALLLLCKTFDPISRTYARMYTLEAFYENALRHHQSTLSQVATEREIDTFLNEDVVWKQDEFEFPSRWWVRMEKKLGKTRIEAMKDHGASQSLSKKSTLTSCFHTQHISSKDLETRESVQLLDPKPMRSSRILLKTSQPVSGRGSPVPLHLINPSLPQDTLLHQTNVSSHIINPQTPSFSSSTLGSSRHQKLLNRLGILKYASNQDKLNQEKRAREHLVRDIREERERALEALIVDRRMIQREKVTEAANLKLDIDVKLQRICFEREREKLQTQSTQEIQRHNTRRRRLTRKFEKSFVAQTGALMRHAARAAVASSLEADQLEQDHLTSTVKIREAEALVRRQDAKSCWFARNRQEKRKTIAVRDYCF
ncbi:Leucine-rich repeat [Plasmopara halstedii]|uniref:Leucine-rich repeat n=1 Tax=Plasmopara halstedii TaxID=4781 RepID=A0A0P1A5K0_PLAHL|nr:Leucine-rich repeat [Plasmopara halstedii]CEG35511.1 Leucine-rich repeat [Plasmopara halstedii]|eukprot:XP_024571880.1 Leucine-rich repeat [Plasmopara halstedii]